MFKNGKTWVTTGTPAYKDRFGLVRMLDRPNTDIILSNGSSYPLYKVLDPVQKDTVNIMEAYLVKVEDATKYIIHIEKQPSAKLSDSEIVHSIKTRLQGRIPEEILSKLFFRFRSFEEGFPVNGTGKTDLIQVAEEGFEAKICIPYMN
jgi:acyl-CoA synthetase (AMP-forming)/AMP-acid ligase II